MGRICHPLSFFSAKTCIVRTYHRKSLKKTEELNCSKLWETKEKGQLNALGDLRLHPESGENSCQGYNWKKMNDI